MIKNRSQVKPNSIFPAIPRYHEISVIPLDKFMRHAGA
jgi:hypothetical protein